jgi:hypothetical protein
MKEKSAKQSKKDKPTVQIKDLKPTKDATGQKRMMVSRDLEPSLGEPSLHIEPIATFGGGLRRG